MSLHILSHIIKKLLSKTPYPFNAVLQSQFHADDLLLLEHLFKLLR